MIFTPVLLAAYDNIFIALAIIYTSSTDRQFITRYTYVSANYQYRASNLYYAIIKSRNINAKQVNMNYYKVCSPKRVAMAFILEPIRPASVTLLRSGSAFCVNTVKDDESGFVSRAVNFARQVCHSDATLCYTYPALNFAFMHFVCHITLRNRIKNYACYSLEIFIAIHTLNSHIILAQTRTTVSSTVSQHGCAT